MSYCQNCADLEKKLKAESANAIRAVMELQREIDKLKAALEEIDRQTGEHTTSRIAADALWGGKDNQ